jgi:Type I phosphodiesterase / nucleotide pyrophosphatase
MFARGYFPGRSGQLFYVPHEGDFIVNPDPLYRFMHGSPWSYDTRVPLLFYGGPFVRPGAWTDPVIQQDVVPTLAALMRTTAPATATGRILQQAIGTASSPPRIIALIVLDGMRVDYFDRYAALMPALSRLRRDGAWFADARVNTIPSQTAIGHATLGTGTDPRIHGLVVNNLYNRVTGKPQEAYDQLDPGELMALTLADTWNLATDGKAIIIGQGGAIRATAGLVGRGACLINGRRVIAASYSTRDGGWETNEKCYAPSSAVKAFSARRYWEQAGGTWLQHDIADPTRFRASAVFGRFEGDALAAVLEHENIGADAVTDLVMVNIKTIDYTSHAYGPDSAETKDSLAEVDRQMARAVQIIERKAGPMQSVIAITADHGMPPEPPAGRRRIIMQEVREAVEKRFSPGAASVIQYFGDAAGAQMHLDTARLAALGFSSRDVAAFLESQFFAAVFTEDEVRAAQSRLK